MTQFADHTDFANRLGLTLSTAEQDRADSLLTSASGVIQERMRQQIELVTDDTYTVRSSYDDRVRLPERPVISVSSVVLTLIGGAATYTPPDNTWYLDRDEIVRTAWPLAAQYAFAGYQRGWLGPLYQMQVTYTHGFETVPELVKSICMEMVTRVWVNPGSVARQTVGDTVTIFDNMRFSPTGMQMTDEEYGQLRDLLRRFANSVTLR